MGHLWVTGLSIAQFGIIGCYHLLFDSLWKRKHLLLCFLNKHLKAIINICTLPRGLNRHCSTFRLSSGSFRKPLSHVNDIACTDIALWLENLCHPEVNGQSGHLLPWYMSWLPFPAPCVPPYVYLVPGSWLVQKYNLSLCSIFSRKGK